MANARRALSVLVLAVVAVACNSTAESVGSAVPVGPVEPGIPHACLGLGEPDCSRALAAATDLLPEAAPVVYVEVGPFGCRAGAGCEPSLAARPEGRVLFELAGADPIEIVVRAAADGSIGVEQGEAFMILLEPSSVARGIGGPVPFSLGHCGIWSGIDLDGSWWDPVGFVNFDHGDAINAADGTFVATDAQHATFTSGEGLVVSLARRSGPKHLPFCD